MMTDDQLRDTKRFIEIIDGEPFHDELVRSVIDLAVAHNSCDAEVYNSLAPIVEYLSGHFSEYSFVLTEVFYERQRQISKEGWSKKHDDRHNNGELASAAASYAHYSYPEGKTPPIWPWATGSWKPKDKRRNMIRAAALLVAEIERLDRLEMKK